jgi:hypothetical protein
LPHYIGELNEETLQPRGMRQWKLSGRSLLEAWGEV